MYLCWFSSPQLERSQQANMETLKPTATTLEYSEAQPHSEVLTLGAQHTTLNTFSKKPSGPYGSGMCSLEESKRQRHLQTLQQYDADLQVLLVSLPQKLQSCLADFKLQMQHSESEIEKEMHLLARERPTICIDCLHNTGRIP